MGSYLAPNLFTVGTNRHNQPASFFYCNASNTTFPVESCFILARNVKPKRKYMQTNPVVAARAFLSEAFTVTYPLLRAPPQSQCPARTQNAFPMQHDSISEEVTPVSDSGHASISRQPLQKPWKPARLTIHPSIKSTPVSLRSRSPFTPIILNSRTAAQTAADVHVVKRKLFSVTSTPRKKRHREKQVTPLKPRQFRISGGKDRTQPVDAGSARKTQRVQGGVLTGQINKCAAAAALNLRVFRTALGAAEVDLKELNALVRKSLILRVIRRDEDLLIARRWSDNDSAQSYDDDFAVVVPPDTLSEDGVVDFKQLVLFVPEPWSAVNLSSSAPSRSGLLVIPHTLELIDLKAMSMVLEKCSLNCELGTWQRVGASSSHYEVPETQDPDAENDNSFSKATDSKPVGSTFSSMSPHAPTASVMVVVDVVLHDFGIAIIRDTHRERAVYQYGSEQVHAIPETQQLNDVRIRSQRMPMESLISLLSNTSSSETEVATLLDHFRRLFDPCALLVFTKHDPK